MCTMSLKMITTVSGIDLKSHRLRKFNYLKDLANKIKRYFPYYSTKLKDKT